MKSHNFACFVFAVIWLGLVIPAHTADSVNPNANDSLTFENAEASNIVIEKTTAFPDLSDDVIDRADPVFSHDFQRLAYCTAEWGRHVGHLIIRSSEDGTIIKDVRLPDGEGHVAWSPDDKRIVIVWDLAPDDLVVGIQSPHLFFVDSDTAKVIEVKIDCAYTIDRVIWPDQNKLKLMRRQDPPFEVDLDNLQVSSLPPEVSDVVGKDFQVSKHKNCILELDSNNRLLICDRNRSYSKMLLANMGRFINYSPDLKYVILKNEVIHNGLPSVGLKLLKLGMRPTPILDFEIKGLDQTLTPEQRQTIKNGFSAGKRIWLSVYDGKTNPINDKVVGPDEGNVRGQGYLTQIEPVFRFKYTFENLPAQTNNIVSSLQVDTGEKWETKVWGILAETQVKDIVNKVVSLVKAGDTTGAKNVVDNIQDYYLKKLVQQEVADELKK